MAAVEPVPHARLAAEAAGPRASRAADPLSRKLRVALVADSALQPQWLVDAFAKVSASDFAEVSVLALLEKKSPGKPPALLRVYSRLDHLAFGEDPTALADLRHAVAHRRCLEDPKPAQVAALKPDVVFVLGALDDAAWDGAARYGVWRFCFGPDRGDPEALAGWRELAEGAPIAASGIRVRVARGAPPRLAYQSWSRTYPLSLARNRDRILRKTAEFAWRALRELHRSGHAWLDQCPQIVPPRAQQDSNRCLTPILRIGGRIAQRGLEKAFSIDQWFLAYRFREERFGDARAVPADFNGFMRLMPPRDRTWADPFPLEKNGRYFVFFEELPFRTGKGRIAMVEVRRDGTASAPVTVLERDYHLSYPFLVEHDGQLLMIPETAQNGTVEAYRCVDFPLRWRRERVLMEKLRAVDATFHRANGRWWMFANAAAPGSRMYDDELHLWHADDLLGEWQPHARNPVKSDARCARPAGALYSARGALYRPAQVCVPLYGAGLSINRVTRLTPDEYAERQVERILPAPATGVLGLHTLNRAGDLTTIDGFTRRARF